MLNVQKFEKQLDDLTQLLTTDELHEFDELNVAEDCKFNLNKSRLVNKPPSIEVFTACRDYIITSLILFNATRLHALWNMTLKEFKNVTISNEGVHMVSIIDHRTSSTSGHHVICFSRTSIKSVCTMWKCEMYCLAQVFHHQIHYLWVGLGRQCPHHW